jgi:hypothetical protein
MTPERLGEIEAKVATLHTRDVPNNAAEFKEVITALREAWGVMDEVAAAMSKEVLGDNYARPDYIEGLATRLRRGRGE